ncbi:ATP-binding protein [Proteiniborus sp.]|uniref:ATP-binding protein n=1 Tax=Proteiniborus sp. TaxID=2079015 RepID=UPI003331C58A
MKNFKKIIVASAIVALASQVNIGFSGTDFRVSGGIILLAILLFQYKALKPVLTGVVSGVAVYFLRLIVYFLTNRNLYLIIWSYQLEILFYTFYGIIYSLLYRKKTKVNINQLLLIMVVSDFGANIVELYVRTRVGGTQVHWEIITTLLFVAIVRSAIVWLVLNGFKYYKMLLMKEEHEERYKRLLWLTAQLKTEMYWMEKNMDNIERIMSNSYRLFEKISLNEDKDKWADGAVTIARDVHEIKKEYELAIRGMKEITENKLQDQGMNFKDIITILEETMQMEIKRKGKNINLLFKNGENFYTAKHYYLMSIFRNLIMNGIDSIPDSAVKANITLTHSTEEEQHIFEISDTGCGINEEDLNHIFSPGFSTKIDYKTGQINRGLGLSVVQDIVENRLYGKITVSSIEGKGTIFEIYVPRKSLEVV